MRRQKPKNKPVLDSCKLAEGVLNTAPARLIRPVNSPHNAIVNLTNGRETAAPTAHRLVGQVIDLYDGVYDNVFRELRPAATTPAPGHVAVTPVPLVVDESYFNDIGVSADGLRELYQSYIAEHGADASHFGTGPVLSRRVRSPTAPSLPRLLEMDESYFVNSRPSVNIVRPPSIPPALPPFRHTLSAVSSLLGGDDPRVYRDPNCRYQNMWEQYMHMHYHPSFETFTSWIKWRDGVTNAPGGLEILRETTYHYDEDEIFNMESSSVRGPVHNDDHTGIEAYLHRQNLPYVVGKMLLGDHDEFDDADLECAKAIERSKPGDLGDEIDGSLYVDKIVVNNPTEDQVFSDEEENDIVLIHSEAGSGETIIIGSPVVCGDIVYVNSDVSVEIGGGSEEGEALVN